MIGMPLWKFFYHHDLTLCFQGKNVFGKPAHCGPRFQDACLQVGQQTSEASRLHAEYLQTIRGPRMIRKEEGMTFMDTDVHSSDSELSDVLDLKDVAAHG